MSSARTRSLAGGWVVLVLVLGALVPVTADLSQYGSSEFDCGPIWSAATTADEVSSLVDQACEDTLGRRPWLMLAAVVLGLVGLVLVRRATRPRPRVPARIDPRSRRSEIALVVIAFAAPAFGLGVILPFLLSRACRRDPRLLVPVARAFDCQFALLVTGVLGAGLVLAGPASTIGGTLLVAAVITMTVLMAVVTWRSVWRSITGESWVPRWRPLLVPSGWGGDSSTSVRGHVGAQPPAVPERG